MINGFLIKFNQNLNKNQDQYHLKLLTISLLSVNKDQLFIGYWCILIFVVGLSMNANVRRYVALVRQLADGGALCPAPNSVRSGCFCTRGAVQGYDVVLFVVALGKTVIRQLAEVPGRSRGRPYRRPLNGPL